MSYTKDFSLSFEFYPPKTHKGIQLLNMTAEALSKALPHFFSITFGAGGSTREGTLETVKQLQQFKIPIAPHLACVGLTSDELIAILKTYQQKGIKHLVALRGDLPSGMGVGSELKYAYELITLIRKVTQDHFHIEVAAYPETHPQSKNALEDILFFKKKVDAGANSAITQYFFNKDAYFYFIDNCVKHSINIPIIPGIMPISHFAKLMRFSDTCGADIPRWLRKRFEAYQDDYPSQQKLGLEVVYNLCNDLMQYGIPGLHFYTLNHAEPSLALVKLLGLDKRFSFNQGATGSIEANGHI